MTRKGEAHETLPLLFHRDGVPPTIVLDGSKEQCHSNFKCKLREADQETKRVTMLEPKITRTPKKTRTHLHRQKRQTTPNNLPKWPKHYRTAPPPMTDFSHYLAKNHATKNLIELKWAPGPHAQYGRTPWGSATV